MIINWSLFYKIVIVQALYLVAMYFILLFGFFLYFGSGAGASSTAAEVAYEISLVVILAPLIIYTIFKIVKLMKVRIADAAAFFVATLILVLFLFWIFCLTDLVGN